MSRKTVDVAWLLQKANTYLERSDNKYDSADKRRGVCSFIETVLHATGNYKGYCYIGTPKYGEPDFDDTRRCYFVHHTLAERYQQAEKEMAT